MRILVTAPNANVGAHVTTLLRARGISHRLAAHTVDKARQDFPGSEVVHFDYGDEATMRGALVGVDVIFLASPGGMAAEPENRFVDLAQSAGVKRVVKLSGLAENHRLVEKHIEVSGLEWTHLRPTWFMQNFSTMHAQAIRSGTLAEPAGTGRTAFIDVRDIAEVAVTVLTEEVHNRQIYPLTGSEALDRSQVAHEISRVIGRPVTYVPLTDEQFREDIGAFMPPSAVEILSDSYAEVRRGKTESVLDTVPRLLKHGGRTFAAFAEDHRAAWT